MRMQNIVIIIRVFIIVFLLLTQRSKVKRLGREVKVTVKNKSEVSGEPFQHLAQEI